MGNGSALFTEAVASIEEASDRLGHVLGWRFLYSPAATLTANPPLLLAGLNPGGRAYHPPLPSMEAGNAYRIESWGAGGGPNPLQVQIHALFEEIALHLGGTGGRLLDATLTSNFCPFRSPSWERLHARPESVKFSGKLWMSIFDQVVPRAAVCLGAETERQYYRIFTRLGWKAGAEHRQMVGWGNITASSRSWRAGSRTVLVVRLPHLSRFAIFRRSESEACARSIGRMIAEAVSREQ